MRNRFIIISMLLVALFLFGCASKEAPISTNEQITGKPVQTNTSETVVPVETTPTEDNLSKITDYNLSTTVTNSTNVTENTTENEKEADALQFGKYILMLDDVTIVGSENCASIRIFDSKLENLLHQGLACKGKDYYWTAPDKHRYRILVTDIAAGYSNNSIWAKVFIYG